VIVSENMMSIGMMIEKKFRGTKEIYIILVKARSPVQHARERVQGFGKHVMSITILVFLHSDFPNPASICFLRNVQRAEATCQGASHNGFHARERSSKIGVQISIRATIRLRFNRDGGLFPSYYIPGQEKKLQSP